MNNALNPFIDSAVQCWGCPFFDRLFSVVSDTAAAMYAQMSMLCIMIFCAGLMFYILLAVWKNIRGGGGDDPMYQKSLKPVLINSLVVFSLLGMGVWLPRFITTITFEPVADITLAYTQTMIGTDMTTVNEKVSYKAAAISDAGFYRPELRDKIIMLMKTTITQFQSYIKLGIAVMDNAFSLVALTNPGTLIKHILIFLMGLYLAYSFFKLFIRFCFYFADIILAMTFFAFFFPLSMVAFVFRNADAAPNWLKNMGKGLGADQFKSVINAIIALSAAVLTYTVIMLIIARFFSGGGVSTMELMNMISRGDIIASALSDDNLALITLSGCIVLVYVVNFLAAEIPNITNMVMSAFDVKPESKESEVLADDAMKLTENIVGAIKSTGKAIAGKEEKKEEKKE